MIGCTAGPRAGRHSHEHGRALACGRLDLERRADQSGALLHAEQAEPLTGAFGCCRIESHAVVLDDQQHVDRRAARE